MDIERELKKALGLHRSGKLAEAAQIYSDILKLKPDHVDALYLMSVLMSQAGNHEMAVLTAYRAAEINPDYFAPYVSLGNALQATGKLEAAVDAFEKAVTLEPNSAEAYNNLASALNALERPEAAANAAIKAIALDRSMADAHNNLGNALFMQRRAKEAADCYRQAVALRHDFGEAVFNLGNALYELGDYEEAIFRFRKAIGSAPDDARRHYNLANALMAAGRMEEALPAYMDAIRREPSYMDAHNNLGCALKDLGHLTEAETCLRNALKIDPEIVGIHWNLALVLLQQGNYAEGWEEYEWRWKTPTFAQFKREFGKPQWNGEAIPGKTLLIHAEQGFGDAIEFARFVPMAAKKCGRLILECRKELKRLFAGIEGVAEIRALDEDLGEFDYHLPMMSLARALGIRLENVPAPIPYLAPPPGAASFADVASEPGLKIGFVWAGSQTRRDNLARSATPDMFRPLAEIPGTRFYSLQVGGDPKALGALADLANVTDLAPRLADFADTASAIAALDLVISVDTGVVHLAGALGKPVWVLLAIPSNGFLWMLGRADSPWYPTARLFRQEKPGEWAPIFADLKAALESLTGN